MNVCCAICSVRPSPSEEVIYNVTRCGHVFHQICLLHWLERSQSCPQCRAFATESTISDVFFNVVDGEDSLRAELKKKKKELNECKIKHGELQKDFWNLSYEMGKLNNRHDKLLKENRRLNTENDVLKEIAEHLNGKNLDLQISKGLKHANVMGPSKPKNLKTTAKQKV